MRRKELHTVGLCAAQCAGRHHNVGGREHRRRVLLHNSAARALLCSRTSTGYQEALPYHRIRPKLRWAH
jgi:hypothetical protein